MRTHWKHLIATPSGKVQHVRRSDGTTDTLYLPGDHLGSVDAVLDASANVLVRTSFDAWGGRRDDDWVGAPSSGELQQIANTTRHGFAGHEMLDNVGLVHMNGRVYEPSSGRMLSADPFVVPMLGSQGFNRYAYVGNQPLTYGDPSGFIPRRPNNPDDGGDFDVCYGFCGGIYIGDRGMSPNPNGPRPCPGWCGPDGDPRNNALNGGPEKTEEVAASRTADSVNVSTVSRMSVEEYGEYTRQHIAELQALLDDVYEAPDIEPYSVWDGVAGLIDATGNIITAGEVILGGGSVLAVPTQTVKRQLVSKLSSRAAARVARIPNGPKFGELRDHAARHSTLHPNAYYNAAVRHLQVGTQFTFRHDGVFKNAFVTRTGPDSFTFTSATTTGRRIFTHIEGVNAQYLRNLGITLPGGF